MNREAGLSHASDAGQGYDPRTSQQRRYLLQILLTPKEAGRLTGRFPADAFRFFNGGNNLLKSSART